MFTKDTLYLAKVIGLTNEDDIRDFIMSQADLQSKLYYTGRPFVVSDHKDGKNPLFTKNSYDGSSFDKHYMEFSDSLGPNYDISSVIEGEN